jgi:hypothetical protein
VEVLLGFEHLTGSHTGRKMADILIKVLNFYGITKDQILTVTSDNAAPNIKLCQELEIGLKLVDKELGGVSRVPCLAHVIQLALKKLVEHIKIKPRNSKIITEWFDDEMEREKHSDALRHDGIPWTLKLVSNLI